MPSPSPRQSNRASGNGAGLHPNTVTQVTNFTLNSNPGSLWLAVVSADCNTGGSLFSTLASSVTTPGVVWNLLDVIQIQTEESPTFWYTRLLAVYYAYNVPEILNSVSTTMTITSTVGTNNNLFGGITIIEIPGIATSVPTYLDNSNNTYPGSSTPSTSNLALGTNSLVLVAQGVQATALLTPGAGYTQLAGAGGGIQYQYASPGITPTAFGQAVNNPWVCIAAAFGPAAPTGFPHAFGSLIGF